jgi:proline racemase
MEIAYGRGRPLRPASPVGYKHPDDAVSVATVDYHTAGEPFRIVLDGVPAIPGATVRERREGAIAADAVQAIRRLLCSEPRGHADMYGGLIVPPDDEGADLGVLFWHKDGFSTACGHGSIALGVWAVDEGRVAPDADGIAHVTIDVPSGRVVVRVRCEDGVPQSATFRNVPAYVLARGVEVDLGDATVAVDVAYGGAIYASLPAAAVGLSVEPPNLDRLIAAGRAIKTALGDREVARHPVDLRLSGIYGVIFHDELGDGDGGPRQRNVTVFADGEVDRSPCGSGTSARVALLADEGRLAPGAVLLHESIIGSEFRAWVVEQVEADGHAGVVTDVDGMAYRTGTHTFTLDPRDPLGAGFVLR